MQEKMKNKTYIYLIFLLLNNVGQGQNVNISSEEKACFNKGGIYHSDEKNCIVCQLTDTIFSPDKKTIVLTRSAEIGDCNTIGTFWLIRKQEKDTTKLMTVVIHDSYFPNFYWYSNNYLIYEYRDYFEKSGTHIQIRNLITNEVEFSTPGVIQTIPKLSQNFYDRENGMLIYFKGLGKENEYRTNLMALDIKARTVKRLMTYEERFEYEFPNVWLDTQNRKLKTKYITCRYCQEIITIEKEFDY